MKRMAKQIYVYKFDEADGQSLYAIATDPDEIPEDNDGQKIGVYVLKETRTFRVIRELK